MADKNPIEQPFDLIKISLAEQMLVKMRGARELTGKLEAYDQHLNLVLSNVEETVLTPEINELTGEELIRVIHAS